MISLLFGLYRLQSMTGNAPLRSQFGSNFDEHLKHFNEEPIWIGESKSGIFLNEFENQKKYLFFYSEAAPMKLLFCPSCIQKTFFDFTCEKRFYFHFHFCSQSLCNYLPFWMTTTINIKITHRIIIIFIKPSKQFFDLKFWASESIKQTIRTEEKKSRRRIIWNNFWWKCQKTQNCLFWLLVFICIWYAY